MAVAIDIGEANDIHPRNKKDVGNRLWKVAQKVAYRDDVLYTGPIFKEFKTDGDRVNLFFDFVGDGLKLSYGEEVKGFILSGDDGVFYPAKAVIINFDSVQLYHPNVQNPKEIRYAWADNPEVNLYNSEDLPAVPFRIKLE